MCFGVECHISTVIIFVADEHLNNSQQSGNSSNKIRQMEMKMHHPYGRKRRTKEPLDESERGE